MSTIHLKLPPGGTYPYKTMDQKSLVLRAILFDLDGVLMDSEPLHLSAFQKALGQEGKLLTEEMYKDRYLSLDDRGAFSTFFKDIKMPLSLEDLQKLVETKATIFEELVGTEGILPFPAVPEFVTAVSQRYPLAVASGSRRNEVELLLETAGIRSHFEGIISADDVKNGKPDPESYLKALDLLNQNGKRPVAIRPEECVVIEDSKQTIGPIHAIGMKCVGVATSYPAFELSGADLVVPNLASLRVSQIEDLYHTPQPRAVPTAPKNN